MKLHLSGPMLSACNGYKVYTNESFAALNLSADARKHLVEGSIFGGMDSPMEGWPSDKPILYSAANTAIFLQAWHSIFQSGIHERFDWIVKVDPDTVFFPDRLRLLVQDHSPDEPFGLFDSGGLCSGGIGGIGVISRAGVKVMAALQGILPLLNVTREDGMLKGALEAFGKGSKPEPNLMLNPVPRLDCSKAPWKVAYHPFKAAWLAGWCMNETRRLEAPIPSNLHSKCL